MSNDITDKNLETIAELECIVSVIVSLGKDQVGDFIKSKSVDMNLLGRYMEVKKETMKRFRADI